MLIASYYKNGMDSNDITIFSWKLNSPHLNIPHKAEDSKRLISFQILSLSQNRSKSLHGFDTIHMYLKKKSVWNRCIQNCIASKLHCHIIQILFSQNIIKRKIDIFEINKIFQFEKQVIFKFFMFVYSPIFHNVHKFPQNYTIFVRNLHIAYFDKIIFLYYDIYAEINL